MLGGKKKPREQKLRSEKDRKTKVNKHEQALADKLGGFRQPQSGAFEQAKGDIKVDKFLLDSKETETNSILVTVKDLTKISREADGEGKFPGLVLTLRSGPATVSKEWVLVPIDVFSELLDKKNENS